MKKLSFKQAEKLHRELYGWCAETGGWKHDWPDLRKYNPKMGCFACEYVDQHDLYCSQGECPIDWGSDDKTCMGDGSPYMGWHLEETDEEENKRIAAIIRDLPWVER